MLFNSLSFYIFFPVITFLYFICPYRWRWALVLVASCYFYMSFVPIYILILALTILVDYLAAIWMEKYEGRKRKLILWLSLITTCLILFIFKYFNFFNANIAALAKFLHWNYSIEALQLILPIGLSFHTFQSLSYVIEVYWGKFKAEKHFGIYALYVMLYPQLVAGPIERPQNLLHQLKECHDFDYKRVTDGLKLMAWGMFKKVVIADRLKVYVDAVYGNPSQYDGSVFILATAFFAFQIFCDFSGYADIAIGAAKVMGIRLMENFNQPYSAKSVGEFWRRWHISLMTWFKDYVYIPLGGSRVGIARGYWNIVTVFLISGLWHGASWTFVVWGLLNGFYIIFGKITHHWRKRFVNKLGLPMLPWLHSALQILTTFSLICFAWIFFRAQSMPDAMYIATHLFSGVGNLASNILIYWKDLHILKDVLNPIFIGIHKSEVLLMIVLIVGLEIVHYFQRRGSIIAALSVKPLWIRWAFYYISMIIIFSLGVFDQHNQFIYFQF